MLRAKAWRWHLHQGCGRGRRYGRSLGRARPWSGWGNRRKDAVKHVEFFPTGGKPMGKDKRMVCSCFFLILFQQREGLHQRKNRDRIRRGDLEPSRTVKRWWNVHQPTRAWICSITHSWDLEPSWSIQLLESVKLTHIRKVADLTFVGLKYDLKLAHTNTHSCIHSNNL